MAACPVLQLVPNWIGMEPADPGTLSRGEFEELVKPVLPVAYRYAARLIGAGEEAMDLVQDASVQSYRARHTFRRGTNFKAWFLKILTNLFYQSRQKRRLETVPLDDAPDLFLYEHAKNAGADMASDDPASWFFHRVEMDQIGEALDRLPEDYREAAILYFVSELSYEEIADTLGVPIGTVRSRLHRARKHLQAALWQIAKERGWIEEEAIGA